MSILPPLIGGLWTIFCLILGAHFAMVLTQHKTVIPAFGKGKVIVVGGENKNDAKLPTRKL